MGYLLNSKKIKYLIFFIMTVIVLSGIYITYKYMNGFDTYVIVSNNAGNLLNEDYKYVDLKVVINDKVIFEDSLRNGLHDTLKVNTKLKFGTNLIEVYSKKANMYDHKIDRVFFNKVYYISFSESPKEMGYYNLSISDN